MTLGMFILVAVALIGVNALFHFNDKFRGKFFGTLWKLKMFVIVPVALWALAEATLGSSALGQIAPQLLLLAFTLVQAIFFSVFQIFIMFWAMGRPQVDWYFPGDASDLDWSHWIGSESVKVEAQKMVESLRNWELYEKNGTKPANGAIFYGPPGTGKSLLAKVIASQANLPVCIAASASLNGPFVAMGMLIVKSLARKIRKNAAQYGGCVVFLDEIDAIGASRGGQNGMGMMGGFGMMGGGMGGNGTLQSLLTEMSGATNGETWSLKLRKRWGLAKKDQKNIWRILWIAATNMDLNSLDPALIRSGRFGSIKLYVGFPNDASRRELFKFYLRKKTLADDIDYDQLVQMSRGMTGADIEETCEAASRTVIYELQEGQRGDKQAVTFEDLWKQIRFKKFGAPSPVNLMGEERWPVAIHESGHGTAVVDFPPAGQLCSGATLRPTENFVAAVMHEKVEERMLEEEEDCYRDVLIAVCSRAAEEVVLNKRFTGVTSDFNQAMHKALNMVEIFGMAPNGRITSTLPLGGGHSGESIRLAEDIVNATFRLAKRYIAERQEAVKALAGALVEKTDLSGPEVIAIVETHGKPSFDSVSVEVKQILAQMKEEEKTGRSSALAAPAAAPVEPKAPAGN